MFKNWKTFLLRHELLIFILCLTAFLRLPSLMEPYWYGDEGIYLTLGTGIRNGLTLYKQIHDNKPPGIYFIAAIAGSMFWFRFILLIWNLTSIAVFHWISVKLLKPKESKPFMIGKTPFPRPTIATFTTLLFALLPFVAEGNVANGEIFMLLPVLIGYALLLLMQDSKIPKTKMMLIAASGFSFSMAFLIKVPAIFDAIAAGVFFFLITKQTTNIKEKVSSLLRSIISIYPWVFAGAFLLPILISIAYYYIIGAGEPYLKAAILQNVGYLSSWSTGTHKPNLAQTGLAGRSVGVGIVTLALIFLPLGLSANVVLVLLWMAYATYGALLSERPYPHYLIQVIPPISLLLAIFIQKLQALKSQLVLKRELGNLILLGLSVGILIFAVVSLKFWSYSIPPYFQNYFKFMTGKISRDQYLAFFDQTLPEQYKLATYIVESTTPSDRIFIWGDLPSLYALTRRLPPGRFTAAYHVKDFNAHDETVAAIVTTPPKLILIDKRIETYAQLTGILAEEYIVVYNSDVFTLYRRVDF